MYGSSRAMGQVAHPPIFKTQGVRVKSRTLPGRVLLREFEHENSRRVVKNLRKNDRQSKVNTKVPKTLHFGTQSLIFERVRGSFLGFSDVRVKSHSPWSILEEMFLQIFRKTDFISGGFAPDLCRFEGDLKGIYVYGFEQML
jgi:hypothetical protein